MQNDFELRKACQLVIHNINHLERSAIGITFMVKSSIAMPGRRPIFASLVSNIITLTRDVLFKAILEPASHEERRKKAERKK